MRFEGSSLFFLNSANTLSDYRRPGSALGAGDPELPGTDISVNGVTLNNPFSGASGVARQADGEWGSARRTGAPRDKEVKSERGVIQCQALGSSRRDGETQLQQQIRVCAEYTGVGCISLVLSQTFKLFKTNTQV